MRGEMLLICPTSQANCLRRINATGKSLGVREIVSSEQQVLSRPGCGAARSAAPLSRDPFLQDGPRISNVRLKRCCCSPLRLPLFLAGWTPDQQRTAEALRCVRGTQPSFRVRVQRTTSQVYKLHINGGARGKWWKSSRTALLPGYEGFFGFCGWMVSPAASIVTNFSILAARVSGFLALCTR